MEQLTLFPMEPTEPAESFEEDVRDFYEYWIERIEIKDLEPELQKLVDDNLWELF